MDTRPPYRRDLPLINHLPLVNLAITEDGLLGSLDYDNLKNKTLQILRKHNIHFRSIVLINRGQASKTGTVSITPIYYILIVMEKSAVDTWDAAVQSYS